MLGVFIEQQIFSSLMEARFPTLCEHLASKGVFFSFLVFEWLICLFVNTVPPDAEFRILDLFFIEGINELLRIALTIISLMEEELLQTEDMAKLQ